MLVLHSMQRHPETIDPSATVADAARQMRAARVGALDAESASEVVAASPTRRVAAAGGDYRCAECGYGVTVRRDLVRCPMCGMAAWVEVATPVSRPVLWFETHRVGGVDDGDNGSVGSHGSG